LGIRISFPWHKEIEMQNKVRATLPGQKHLYLNKVCKPEIIKFDNYLPKQVNNNDVQSYFDLFPASFLQGTLSVTND
jgi:hypothetical protein